MIFDCLKQHFSTFCQVGKIKVFFQSAILHFYLKEKKSKKVKKKNDWRYFLDKKGLLTEGKLFQVKKSFKSFITKIYENNAWSFLSFLFPLWQITFKTELISINNNKIVIRMIKTNKKPNKKKFQIILVNG
jgi:hypothetical protein